MADKKPKRLPPKLPSGERMVPNKVYKSTRAGKKKMVYATEGSKSKLIHFGDSTMKDYTQHGNAARRKNYLSRSAGIKDKNGKLTKDNKLSPNYWSRRILWILIPFLFLPSLLSLPSL
jgi:hypothetical protein